MIGLNTRPLIVGLDARIDGPSRILRGVYPWSLNPVATCRTVRCSMSYKSDSGSEVYGSASPGWTKPHRNFSFVRAGGNTGKADLMKKPPQYIENPFTWSGSWETTRQSAISEFGTIRFTGTQSLTGYPVFDSVNYPTGSDLASKLMSKWRESEFNLGVSIGEGRESVELIVGRMTDIAKAANAVRKGNLGTALRHLAHVPKSNRRSAQLGISVNALSSAWLELEYGWSPLIKDIGAAAEMIKLHPKTNRVKARSSNRGGAHLDSPSHIGDVVVYNNDRRLQNIVVVSSPPSLQERLGLTDPLSIAWELVPFSFVLDWFGPISDYLAALHAVNTMPVVKCIQTISSKQIANINVNSSHKFFGLYPVTMAGSTSTILISGTRSIYPSLPTAWLATVQVPRKITNNYEPGLQRIADASALVQQNLKKLLR